MVSPGYQFAVYGHVPDRLLKIVTCGIGELLEVVIGPAQFLLGLFLLVNVGIRPDPNRDVTFRVAHRVSPAQMPAVHSVGAAEAVLKMEWLASFKRTLPVPDVPFEIVGMNDSGP